MQIFICFVNQISQSLDVEPSDTIENISQKIQDQIGILPSSKELFFNGVLLSNSSNTLSDYNIGKNGIIYYKKFEDVCEKCNYGLVILIVIVLFSIGYYIKRGHHYATN